MSGPKSSFRAKAPQVFCHTEQSGVFTRGCSDATRRSCSQDGPHHPLAASGRILCPPAGCLIGLSFVKSFGFILVPFYGLQGQSYHASVPKARTLKHQMDKTLKIAADSVPESRFGPSHPDRGGAGLSSLFVSVPALRRSRGTQMEQRAGTFHPLPELGHEQEHRQGKARTASNAPRRPTVGLI